MLFACIFFALILVAVKVKFLLLERTISRLEDEMHLTDGTALLEKQADMEKEIWTLKNKNHRTNQILENINMAYEEACSDAQTRFMQVAHLEKANAKLAADNAKLAADNAKTNAKLAKAKKISAAVNGMVDAVRMSPRACKRS